MTTIVEYLASYVTSLRFEDLPPEVVHQAKRLIVDSIGCAIGGYSARPAQIARQIAHAITAERSATVIGSLKPSSPDLACFANGVMLRYLDFNDGYTSSESGHPSDSIAAALTAAEVAGANGRELIAATVIAYEVFCRVCDVVDLKPLGFDHVTIGGMASTAAAARLYGLSETQTREAFNLGIAPNIALYQTRIGSVSMWKGCAYANASRNAIFAATLASLGMTGPDPIFEGIGGYFKAVSREPFTLAPFGGGDQPYKIMECSIKRFPLGQYSQTVVEAALELRSKIRDIAEIDEIRVATVRSAIRLMAGDPEKWRPANRETADHSLPYTVAVALKYGTVERQHFDERYLRDPALLELAQRVKVEHSEAAERRAPEAMLCELALATRSGQTFRAEVAYHRGHYKNPMTDGEVENKFRSLCADCLPAERTNELLERLWHLDAATDVGGIIRLTQIGAA
jgi:2-methylcitrate dehydratase